MDHYAVSSLRENQVEWALLRAQNAAPALTLFMAAFTRPDRRTLGRLEQELLRWDWVESRLFTAGATA